jgi:N-acetylmuramoyl-L-alanine amidase
MLGRGCIAGALCTGLAMAGAIPAGAAVPHRVVAGDTLWSIAASNNFTTRSVAAYNGLSPSAQVIIGSTVMIPSVSEAASSPGAVAAPRATGERTTASQIRSLAAQHAAPPSVAAGLAWQESGFNNGFVSSAGARGVMQITPATWDFVNRYLATSPLDPSTAEGNVRAGVLYLNYLQRQTGDLRTAIGAYYQGLASVRRHGLLPGTQHYVDNVLAGASRFGG